jgi:hypothetical protein
MAMDHINDQRKKSDRVVPTPATILVGEGAVLDSLLLLSFLVAAEERLLDEHGLHVSLLDLIANEPSPLRSIGTLTDHLVSTCGAA